MELVMDDKIKVFRTPKAKVEEQCAKYELAQHNGGFKYLTALSLDCFVEEELHKLYNYTDKLTAQVKELQDAAISDLWENDLNNIKL